MNGHVDGHRSPISARENCARCRSLPPPTRFLNSRAAIKYVLEQLSRGRKVPGSSFSVANCRDLGPAVYEGKRRLGLQIKPTTGWGIQGPSRSRTRFRIRLRVIRAVFCGGTMGGISYPGFTVADFVFRNK